MKFKAILMDNDGTLMDFKAGEINAIGEVLNRLHIDDPNAPAHYSCINDRCWKDFEKGLVTQPQLRVRRFQELIEHYHCGGNPVEIAQWYEDALARQSILLQGALNVVQTVSKHLPILILTNGIARVQHGRIESSPIAPYLSGLLISSEIGAPKPAPDMYLKALEILNLKPHEVLMIGDSLTSDIAGAIRVGIPTCWYNPSHHLKPINMSIDYEIDRMEQMIEVALSE